MPKYPINQIFMGFAEKSVFFPNFCPYYSMTIWRLWAQKLINTILAEFGSFPPKKKIIPQFLGNSACNFQRKSQKIKNNYTKYFISFFAFFSKTVGLSSVFNAEMNSACQNTLVAAFLWDLQKKAFFPRIFALTIV